MERHGFHLAEGGDGRVLGDAEEPVFAGVDGQIIDVKYNTSTYAPNFTRVRVGPFMVIYGHIAGPSSFNSLITGPPRNSELDSRLKYN